MLVKSNDHLSSLTNEKNKEIAGLQNKIYTMTCETNNKLASLQGTISSITLEMNNRVSGYLLWFDLSLYKYLKKFLRLFKIILIKKVLTKLYLCLTMNLKYIYNKSE